MSSEKWRPFCRGLNVLITFAITHCDEVHSLTPCYDTQAVFTILSPAPAAISLIFASNVFFSVSSINIWRNHVIVSYKTVQNKLAQ